MTACIRMKCYVDVSERITDWLFSANLESKLTLCLLAKLANNEPVPPSHDADLDPGDLDINKELITTIVTRKFSTLSVLAEYVCARAVRGERNQDM